MLITDEYLSQFTAQQALAILGAFQLIGMNVRYSLDSASWRISACEVS